MRIQKETNVKRGIKELYGRSRQILEERSGITGLETAIVLIAFIVVAAVFAFAVLTTGLFSTEKAKQTALAGLDEATNTLEPKGAPSSLKNRSLQRIR